MTRLLIVAFDLALQVALPAPALAQDDLPDQCRTIIGCPDAGPEPENPGDRGGWAQLMTLGVLALAVAFVMTKVIRAARAAQPGEPS